MNRVVQWVRQLSRWKVAALVLTVALGVLVPWGLSQVGQVKSYREILNDVHDRANHRLMADPWAGGLATAQGQLLTETEIWNDVYDDANHRLMVSGAGGGGSSAFADLTSGTNATAAMIVTAPATLSGNITATQLSANPANCPLGQAAGGISATGISEDCFTPGGSASFSGLTGGTNTTAAMVVGSGASLGPSGTGSVTATQWVSDPTNCGAGQAAAGVDLFGAAQGCFTPASGTPAFSALTSGINTTAAMQVGTGASLGPTGTGTILATTAVALATNPADCAANMFGTAIAANGDLTCAQVGFAALTGGTNTTAALTVGTGASLGPSGTGTITATQLAVNPANCPGGQAAGGVSATGAAEDCFTPAGGSTAFSSLTSGTNTTATMTVTAPAVLSGNIVAATAGALSTNGTNCILPNNAAAGVDAAGTAEGCFDAATDAELTAHAALTTVHGAVSTNTPSTIVQRDASGNFSAGTITATLAGNAATATQLTTDPANCPAGQAPAGITATGAVEGCFTPAGTGTGLPDPGTNGFVVRNSAAPTTTSRAITGTPNQIAVTNGDGVAANPQLSIPTSPTLPGTTSGTFSGPLSGNATTATALAANGSNCTGGQVPTGVDASGNVEGCFTPATGSNAFSALTGGTNTTAAMLVGTGASLSPTGTGTILATTATALAVNPADCAANTFGTALAANGDLTCAAVGFAALASGTSTTGALLIGTGASLGPIGTGTITATTLSVNPANCPGGQAAGGISATGVAEDCFTPAGGSTAFSALTGGTNTAAAMTVGTGASLAASGTGTISATGAVGNPGNCPAGQAASGIDGSFAAEGCTAYAAADIPVLTSTAVAGLTAEVNLGGMPSGILRQSVTGGIATVSSAELSGDCVTSGSNTCTIPADTITFAKMQNIPTLTVLGKSTAGLGDTEAMSVATARTLLQINNVDNTADSQKNSDPRILTNAEIVPRVLDQLDTGTIAVNCALYDAVRIDELSQPTSFSAPTTCTPDDDQRLTFLVFSTVARALTFTTGTGAFSAGYGMPLPTTSYAGQWVKYAFHWNSILARWAFDGSTQTTLYGTAGQCFRSNGPGVEPTWQACPTGGGTTGERFLPVTSVDYPITDPALLAGNENNARLLFDNNIRQCAYWGPFRMNLDYLSSPVPVLKLQYSMMTAVASNVVIDIDVMAVTPGDAVDVGDDVNYGTANVCPDPTPVPATQGFLKEMSCTLTNNDTLAAGDLTKIRICRNVAHATDQASGAMEVLTAVLQYTK